MAPVMDRIDTDLMDFSHGLRDAENGIPRSRPRTPEHEAYHMGYDCLELYEGPKAQIDTALKRDYRG